MDHFDVAPISKDLMIEMNTTMRTDCRYIPEEEIHSFNSSKVS